MIKIVLSAICTIVGVLLLIRWFVSKDKIERLESLVMVTLLAVLLTAM